MVQANMLVNQWSDRDWRLYLWALIEDFNDSPGTTACDGNENDPNRIIILECPYRLVSFQKRNSPVNSSVYDFLVVQHQSNKIKSIGPVGEDNTREY